VEEKLKKCEGKIEIEETEKTEDLNKE